VAQGRAYRLAHLLPSAWRAVAGAGVGRQGDGDTEGEQLGVGWASRPSNSYVAFGPFLFSSLFSFYLFTER
jgi:hypothetical protein